MAALELLQGTLDLLVLKTLTWGPMHGYAVARMIREKSGDVFLVEEGALYPALHRLEKQGWIASEWRISEKNQRAKYYQLTPAGKQQLVAASERWKQVSGAIASLMSPNESEGTA